MHHSTGSKSYIHEKLAIYYCCKIFNPKFNFIIREKLVDQYRFPPLLSYLEVLPLNFTVNHETILSNLSGDGSLFRSPSATAAAFLATQNMQSLSYLCHLLRSGNGEGKGI